MTMLFSILLFSHLLYGGYGYNYHNFFAWGDVSISCTTGKNQSPIDLRNAQVIEQNDISPPLHFKNFHARPQQVELTRNTNYVILHGIWQGDTPEVTGPVVLLGQTYIFNHVHHHHSTDNNNGSEHSINGKKYTSELHVTYYNNKYQNLSQALKQPDGLMMIAVLYYVDDAVSPDPGMELFSTYVKSFETKNSKRALPEFNPSQLLSNPVGSFYSYSGSTTVPPCIENVRWIVMAEPQPINTQIINVFRNITLADGNIHNVRPLQATNNRLIKFYKKNTEKNTEKYTERYTEKNGLRNFIKIFFTNITN